MTLLKPSNINLNAICTPEHLDEFFPREGASLAVRWKMCFAASSVKPAAAAEQEAKWWAAKGDDLLHKALAAGSSHAWRFQTGRTSRVRRISDLVVIKACHAKAVRS